jgi:hypothetical protein
MLEVQDSFAISVRHLKPRNIVETERAWYTRSSPFIENENEGRNGFNEVALRGGLWKPFRFKTHSLLIE